MRLHIQNMVSNRSKMIVKSELEKLGLHFIIAGPGEVEIMESLSFTQLNQLNISLMETGFAILSDRKSILIDKIKNIIIEVVYNSDVRLKINFSYYLSQKLDYDYTYLSNIFKENQGITIEHFVLIHKIERIKELLVYDELNISEIADKLHYSSASHLTIQFKKITGLTPTSYRRLKLNRHPQSENV